ncbi:sialate O-acetylesterase [Salegentibacter echinorum]|uniref:Sialate O-acetylesterase n=1 Tax=Salegentibacter echinorum TaxID=1073325 RepID=A0A1M5HZE0_SALEC|nr:sialate O-acetylesterase [Salegentibacter echinorum]SHG21242.1 sialate O-acetylesterase [Salegentibacter echinorum]
MKRTIKTQENHLYKIGKNINYFIRLSIFLLFCFSAQAQLSLADIFTDNMVLQRKEPIHVWGTAKPGEKIIVKFSSEEKETISRPDASWEIVLSAKNANVNPQKLKISSETEQLEINNILIGDVWLLTGQSNMEWPLKNEKHYSEEQKQLAGDKLRFFNPTYVGKGVYSESFKKEDLKNLNAQDFYRGNWEVSGSKNTGELSAIGYYFAKELIASEEIPIGLINLAIGGAPIEAFIAEEDLQSNFSKKIGGNWLKNNELPVWIRERGDQNVGHLKDIPEAGPNHGYKPGFAYKAGIKPIKKFPITGVLWYQGESNAQEMERVKEYKDLQKLLIENYRNSWQKPELPFYWVGLSSIDTLNYKSHFWPEFRNQQLLLVDEMENVGMAVSTDVGAKNDVHPRDKKTVGKRLSRLALNEVYGNDIIVSGPIPKSAEFKNGKIYITFKSVGNGLRTRNNGQLKGFSVNGKSGVKARIKGNQVIIEAKKKPDFVYYNWQPWAIGTLINKEGLPAPTFKLKILKK